MHDARTPSKILTPTRRKKLIAERAERRRRNKTILRKQNDKLPAGSPMYFYCPGCGAELVEPEGYIRREKLCVDCQELGDVP